MSSRMTLRSPVVAVVTVGHAFAEFGARRHGACGNPARSRPGWSRCRPFAAGQGDGGAFSVPRVSNTVNFAQATVKLAVPAQP